jgi:hypothetical protein
MKHLTRPHAVKVTLTDNEVALLDEHRPSGLSRPAYFRTLLNKPLRDADVASRQESLAMLTALARDGGVAAAIALERATRAAPSEGSGDVLDDILGAK